MKIVIIGAGAMGGLFTAKLTGLAEVWLVGSWHEHIQAMQQHGLRLTEIDGAETIYPVRAIINPADVPEPVDVVIINVKSHRTAEASRKTKALLKANGLALTMQNGLGNLEEMSAIFGEERVVQGVTSHGATLVGPGHIRHAGRGMTYLATRPDISERIRAVQTLFEQAGFETHLSESLDSLLWGKLIVNVGINAITAILNAPNGSIASLKPARHMMASAVAEAVAVAQAKGIVLPYANPQAQVEKVAQATASNRSSMLADVIRRAPTEIGVINGAIVREGKRLGIPTPVNQTLVWLVQAIEARYQGDGEKVDG